MFYLIQSNQMESLSAQLANLLNQTIPGVSVLQPEHILVQSPGMSTWLRLEIARQNGIAAALEFPLPSSFTWQLCHALLPNVPTDNAFTKAAMTWKLMDLLPSLLEHNDFGPLRHYLSKTLTDSRMAGTEDELEVEVEVEQPHHPLKLYQLCARIADIFDQYLVYRPDWILEWESTGWQNSTSVLALNSEQMWQPVLWRALIAFNANSENSSQYHRANLHSALIAALQNPDTSLAMLPKRLFVFGISSMAPQTLEVLYHLATRIDVIQLSLSPCQHYWGDIVDPKTRARMALKYAGKQQLAADWEDTLEVGNPLLANNGKMGRELLDLMLSLPPEHTDFSYDIYQDPMAHTNNESSSAAAETTPHNKTSTMLHGVQHDILEMETLGRSLGPDAALYQDLKARRILSSTDDSITLRSCHSPLREIETLHDHLLAKLAENPQLTPKDIVVMMPDVAAYAPYIDAVFAAKQGAHYIPYAIADRGAAQESPLINSFLHLLGIHQSRYGLTDIMSILEVPAILRRFNLDVDELQLIRRWLEDAGVRWGRDEQSRAAQGLAKFNQNSWAFGIKRLILGYALSDDAPLYQDSLKVEGIEGQSAQALGKLLNFIEVLDGYQQTMAQNLHASARLTQLEQLLNDFYDVDDDERPQLQEVRDALASLHLELSNAGFNQPLAIDVLQNWFTTKLTESRVGQRYLAGSVNFCTLMPMRSIPFKLVCLLGMNDGVYPRVQHPVGFDLMAHFGARKGDRSRRLDDRYLFLEALLSAREQLYISYIGASERDNSERIPSMLVSELVEYCQLSYLPTALTDGTHPLEHCTVDLSERALLRQIKKTQPLQPFDARLYQPDDRVVNSAVQQPFPTQVSQSYSAQWCPPTRLAAQRNDELSSLRFLQKTTHINIQADVQGSEAFEAKDELDLSALVRFYRNPAQYFFNRTLKVDLRLDIQADDNDEPFSLNALSRYQLQSLLLDNAIEAGRETVDAALILSLKARGDLPMAPFDDLLLNQYQHDIAPLIGRTLYLKGNSPTSPRTNTVEIDLMLQPCTTGVTSVGKMVRLTGRIDDVGAKGLVSYRPGTAHGRDLLRLYIRHLAVNAMGLNKTSYLLDIGHFHALAAIDAVHAKALLTQLIEYFYQGQLHPLCFMPRTSLAYVQAQGEHEERLFEAQSEWLDEQSQLGEGTEPHYQRLFRFPDDFTEADFGALAVTLLSPLLSVYHKDTLAKLADYCETERHQIHQHDTTDENKG